MRLALFTNLVLAEVPEDARRPLIELGAEGRCRVDAERRYRSAVVEAVYGVSPQALQPTLITSASVAG